MSTGQIKKMRCGYQRVVSHLSAWPDCPVGAGLFTICFSFTSVSCRMLSGGKMLFGPARSPVDFPYKVTGTALRIKRIVNSHDVVSWSHFWTGMFRESI